jgi:cell division protein ZapB
MPENAITPSTSDLDIELQRLDQSVDILLGTIKQLREENTQLRAQQEFLQIERSRLMEKTETARTRVEAIINRLKAMENHN